MLFIVNISFLMYKQQYKCHILLVGFLEQCSAVFFTAEGSKILPEINL